MSEPTLTLAMIVKDVETSIGPCLDSVKEYVDEIVITDTGSTDGTKAAVLKAAPNARILDFTAETNPEAFLHDVEATWKEGDVLGPYTGKKMLTDFGAARQHGWNRVTGDYVMWLDSDDVLAGAEHLREILLDMRADGIDTAFLPYDYSFDHHGNVTCRLTRERITRRAAGARWGLPIHEILGSVGKPKSYEITTVVHHRHIYNLPPEVNHRNLKALLNFWKGKSFNNDDPRMLYYLARDEIFVWPDRAIEHFGIYCERSGWDAERASAYMFVGKLHEDRAVAVAPYDQAKLRLAFAAYSSAVVEDKERPEGYFGLARIAYWKNDWGKCIEWTEKGLQIAESASKQAFGVPLNMLDLAVAPFVYYSVALINAGRYDQALEACNAGLKVNPDDPHLKGNHEFLTKRQQENAPPKATPQTLMSISRHEALNAPPIIVPPDIGTAFAIQLWKQHIHGGHHESAMALLDALPMSSLDPAQIGQARDMTRTLLHGKGKSLAITIWTGSGWERWSPASINTTGIGGSETAAVHMARELTRLGHVVTVAADCESGVYDGITYIDYKTLDVENGLAGGDVFISSRQPAEIQRAKRFKLKVLWIHDIHVGSAVDQVKQFDFVFALSKWHKGFLQETYPSLEPHKIVITRNGIDKARYAAAPQKDGNKLIYSSSWDRGLELLLTLLPRIRAQVPDVKLLLFYGAQLWKNMRPDMAEQIGAIEAAIAAGVREGMIVNRGRVGQDELAKAQLASKVWLYPTWFSETYCITALEMQAAGCVPVTTALAALPETVKHGVLINPPCETPAAQALFIEQTVRLLRDETARHEMAAAGREYVLRNCGWDQVALEWVQMFREKIYAGVAQELSGSAEVASSAGSSDSSTEQRVVNPKVAGSSPASGSFIETLPRPQRVAVMMGRLSTAIHGIYDIDTLFDQGLLTGTGTGFFNCAWGLAERGAIVDVFCQAIRRFIGHPKLAGANVYNIDEPGLVVNDDYDAYIAINEPDLLRQAPASKLRICAMWLNDWSYTSPGFDEHVDIYACPSWTHARYIATTTGIRREKLTVVPLSFNPEFYALPISKDRRRVAWCSSPDRGLQHLLACWPEIRTRVLDAELRIYYRFQPWIDLMTEPAHRGSTMYERAATILEQLDRLGRNGEQGVYLIDSVPSKTMAKELLAARVLAYPCDPVRFTEGFSVSVLDACAAGCVPIIPSVDAFPEVYSGVAHMIPGRPGEQHDVWVEAIVKALTDDDFAQRVGTAAKAFAAGFTRQKIAAKWEMLINERRKS